MGILCEGIAQGVIVLGGNCSEANVHGGQLFRGNCLVPHRHSISKELMLLVYHVIMKYGWEPLMVSHHRAKLGGHCHCGSRDIMFLVIQEKDSRCSRVNPLLLFISKGHGWQAHNIY